jgi:phage virion morphogenesis protein
MAGARQTFDGSYDDAEVQERLRKLDEAAGDLTPAMKNIGEYLVQSTEDNFDRQTDPDGRPWQDVKPATRARKKHPKILTESHHLRGSINYRAGQTSVAVGTNVPYAAAHQFGFTGQVSIPAHTRLIKTAFGQPLRHPVWARIEPYTLHQDLPARPFLGIGDDDETEIVGIVEDHMAMALKK